MKKIIMLGLALVLTSCKVSYSNTETKETKSDKKNYQITVTTSFLEDMVNQLHLENIEVQVIIPNGEDPHTYEPKPEDFQKIVNADIIFYHGLHFEGKMIEMLEAKDAVNISSDFSKEELLTMSESGQEIIDPHFWFDIDLYKKAFSYLSNTLKEKLPKQAEHIEIQMVKYIEEIDEVAQYTKQMIEKIPQNSRYLVSPHDAFQYFSRYYKIHAIAPQGVSTDSEVSNKDVLDTVQFIVTNKIKAIFTESTTDPTRMKKIQESVRAKGFEVQVVSGIDGELYSDSLGIKNSGAETYLKMIKHNVDTIVKYLK